MKKLMMLCVVGIGLAVSSVAMAGPQQERMRACSKDAKEQSLKGSERKAFMKNCLRKKPAAAEGGKAAAEPARAKK